MKTTIKITALAITLLMGVNASAQSLNFSGGISLNKLNFEDSETYSSTENFNGGTYTSEYAIDGIVAPTFGLSYEFNFGSRFGLEAGFRYSQRGFKSTQSFRYENGTMFSEEMETSNYKLNYVDLPLTFNTYITTGELKSYVRMGVYAGFMVSQSYTSLYESNDSDGYNVSSEYSSNEMDFDSEERLTGGLQLGAGASYKGFFFETNLNIGTLLLSDFDFGVSTRDVAFTVGYKLDLSKK
jgi:hypothetical protein